MSPSSVLVVDDETPIREILTRWLSKWGHPVRQAPGANEALEAMRTEPAAIMICDIKMPEHDGIWLVERVSAQWPRTVIIMASGSFGALTTATNSQLAGVVDYVSKPFSREDLQRAVTQAEMLVAGKT
jgi:DNA-binding NtrC family response regulator